MLIPRIAVALALAICFLVISAAHAHESFHEHEDESWIQSEIMKHLLLHMADEREQEPKHHNVRMNRNVNDEGNEVVLPLSKDEKLQLRDRVMTSLEKLVHYLDKHTNTMPVDTLYGIRGMEGLMLEIVQDKKHRDHAYMVRIRKLLGNVQQLSAKVANDLSKGSQREYYLQFKPVVQQPVTPLAPLELGKTLGVPFYDPNDMESERRAIKARRKNPKYKRRYSEDHVDICLEQAIHCKVTNHCMNVNQLRFTKGYQLTHQVLYYLFLWQRCKNTLPAQTYGKVGHNLKSLTSIMHAQYKKDKRYSDLWVERVLFGILAGYHKYFLTERLAQYLTSNHFNEQLGCWRDEDGHDDNDGVPREHSGGLIPSSAYTTMRDVDIGDGCSFHTSGIVGWILAAHLRYHA